MFLALLLLPAQIFIDTIGWTDRDRQFLFSPLRYLVNDTVYGISAIYKSGYGEIRYNFRPRGSTWRFSSGIVVNQYPRNSGCLEYNIRNGKTYISADYLQRGKRLITIFVDSAPGAGRFNEQVIFSNGKFPLVGSGRYGYPKFAAIKDDTLYYFTPWSSYRVGPIGPFPRHNLIASKTSSRLGFLWTDNDGRLNLRETPDGGGTWYRRRILTDSIPSTSNRSLFGAHGTYDSIHIHIIADLYDGHNRGQVQLWHYSPSNTPPWSFVHEFIFPDTTKLGRYTAALCHPSIGIDRRRRNSDLNQLYIVWEQFDPENIDSRTGIARADIWASHSPNNGKTWTEPIRLTSPDSTSKRFPFLAELVDDSLHIIYFADRLAGCWELGEGEKTSNPVLYLKVPTSYFSGQPPAPPPPKSHAPHLVPPITPTNLSGVKPSAIYNSLGRKLSSEKLNQLPPGIYFIQSLPDSDSKTYLAYSKPQCFTQKLLKLR
ncbi:MAG: hypothetical protein ACUVUD_00125 [bacterium]